MELTERVAESRRRQGLPDHIADPGTLQRIALLLLASETESPKREGRAHHGAANASSEVKRDGSLATTT